jgi:hypothetical protein
VLPRLARFAKSSEARIPIQISVPTVVLFLLAVSESQLSAPSAVTHLFHLLQ